MSVFVKQTATPCAFTSSESWVILSPIEQSIKRKIEATGTPLKDWNIQINYGIKTGCNEAFIINEAKRAEILANCRDAAERNRTEQIIRPNNLHPIVVERTIHTEYQSPIDCVSTIPLCKHTNAYTRLGTAYGIQTRPLQRLLLLIRQDAGESAMESTTNTSQPNYRHIFLHPCRAK